MLQPGAIPDKEPLIRVGIILPEDHFRMVEIELTQAINYQIICDDTNLNPQPGKKHTFELSTNSIIRDDEKKSGFWKIKPKHSYSLEPGLGIKVKNILAGRGFHWEKTIDVFLPGSIEISIFEHTLILTNELPLEEYLMCVATSEMGAECPPALIKSQTIAARSWILANIEQKHVYIGMDVCNDDCCQRYHGSTNLTMESIAGAQQTYGQVLLFQNNICDARYSKSCGGLTETFRTIWSGKDREYLKNIPDAPSEFTHPALPLTNEEKVKEWIDSTPDTFCSSKIVKEASLYHYLGSVDKESTYFRWQIEYDQKEFCKLLRQKLNLSIKAILGFKAIQRGGSGRLSQIQIIFRNSSDKIENVVIKSEFKIREVFHKEFLYSSCFYIIPDTDSNGYPEKFRIVGAGWGHGVGYCQIGALGMALQGYKTADILTHYYPGSELKKIY